MTTVSNKSQGTRLDELVATKVVWTAAAKLKEYDEKLLDIGQRYSVLSFSKETWSFAPCRVPSDHIRHRAIYGQERL